MVNALDAVWNRLRRFYASAHTGAKLMNWKPFKYNRNLMLGQAILITILAVYAQFRDNFDCNVGDTKMDKKILNNLCWTNGTKTIHEEGQLDSQGGRDMPHVGHNFLNENENQSIKDHSYVRNNYLTALVLAIIPAASCFLWNNFFLQPLTTSVLKLPGCERIESVSRAEKDRPYQTLMDLGEKAQQSQPNGNSCNSLERRVQSVRLNLAGPTVVDSTSEHITDQFIYYMYNTLSSKNLANKLLVCCWLNVLICLAYTGLPVLVFGPDYTWFGWFYAKHVLAYLTSFLLNGHSDTHIMEYELSGRIFPTSTLCHIKSFGLLGLDSSTHNCVIPMNDIFGKYFAFYWVYSLFTLSYCTYFALKMTYFVLKPKSLNQYWPEASLEADALAAFPNRSLAMMDQLSRPTNDEHGPNNARGRDIEVGLTIPSQFSIDSCNKRGFEKKPGLFKRICNFMKSNLALKKSEWPDDSSFDGDSWRRRQPGCFKTKEPINPNTYFLMYLIYHRLGCSRRRTQQVIIRTHSALLIFYKTLNQVERDRVRGQAMVDIQNQELASQEPNQGELISDPNNEESPLD